MKRTWLGHSTFLLENDAGKRLVTDPVDAKSLPNLPHVHADVVTVSHRHFDHCAVERIGGDPIVKESLDAEQLAGFTIRGFAAYHDPEQGRLRGTNTIFLIEADGERAVHCGDLGHIPDAETIEALKGCDVLLIPVGGIFTVDGRTAWQITKMIAPRTVVPMHFATHDLGFHLEPVEHFLDAAKADPAPILIDLPSR